MQLIIRDLIYRSPLKQGSRETDWNLRLQFTRVKSYFDYGKQKKQIPLKIASGTFRYNSKKDKDFYV